MGRNVGGWDRAARAVGALGMIVCAVIAPMPLVARVGLVVIALYVTGTALVGTCLGYRLMGKSTCPVR
ncbi:YgaP family membrane protein [Sandaracinus amylolyticus]|uniref:YgaP family membrane protein n=1 Tax=Sandaracinus amylolyticus TaxID=927083 RepID=UPI001F2234AD|nr:DUF2892 domain-containing protein [Sandaracinus amylolyticus]UJR82163.1 Hypothetical protein I5071_42280 [Sandaracinus amylolyticus]